MGNTKYVSFAGDIYRGEESFFSEQALLEVAHGDHVAVKVLPTYLHLEGFDLEPDDDPFVIGHLTTHSMGGFSVVDHIIGHMKSGHIQRTDADCGDSYWIEVEERKGKQRIEFFIE